MSVSNQRKLSQEEAWRMFFARCDQITQLILTQQDSIERAIASNHWTAQRALEAARYWINRMR